MLWLVCTESGWIRIMLPDTACLKSYYCIFWQEQGVDVCFICLLFIFFLRKSQNLLIILKVSFNGLPSEVEEF